MPPATSLPSKTTLEDPSADPREVFQDLRAWVRERQHKADTLSNEACALDVGHRRCIFAFLCLLPEKKPIFSAQSRELLASLSKIPEWRHGGAIDDAALGAALAAAGREAARRRLQAATPRCARDRLGVQRTTWSGVNPHRHVANARDYNPFVMPNATVVTARLCYCDEELRFDLFPHGPPLRVDLPVAQRAPGEKPDDYKEITTCLWFDDLPTRQIWRDKYASLLDGERCGPGEPRCSCLATRGGGSYVAINRFVSNYTTTTTATTTATATSAEEPLEATNVTLVAGLAGGGATLFCCCVVSAVAWKVRQHRLRKRSRVAAIDEGAQVVAKAPPARRDMTEEEKEEERRRQAMIHLENTRVKALAGDEGARKELLTRARTDASPSAQLIAAVDELAVQLKRERAVSKIRDIANPLDLASRGPPPAPDAVERWSPKRAPHKRQHLE